MNSEGTATWLYVAACLLVPTIWGAACAWLFSKLDARRLAQPSEETSAALGEAERPGDAAP